MEEEEDQEFDRAANCNTRFDHEAVAILEHHGRRIGVIGSKSLAVDDAEDSTTEEQVVTHDVAAPHARLVGVSEGGLAAHGMLTLWPGVIDTESRKKTVSGKENSHHPVVAHPAAGALTLSTGLRTLVGLKSRRRFSGSGLLEVLNWHDDAQQGRDAADDDAAAHVKVMISDDRGLKERISSSLSIDDGEEEEEEDQQEEQQELAAARLHRIRSFEGMEAVFSDKVNEVEMHVDVLRKRLERAEFMIADLCKQQHSGTDDHEDGRRAGLVAAASGHNAVQQTHRDLEEKDQLLRADVNYAHKKDDEEQKMRVLQESVDGLQELCMNHEKSLYELRQALKNHHGCFKDDDDAAALGSSKKKKKKMNKMNKNNDQELLQLQSWELYRLSDLETAADDLRRELAAARRETTLLRFENKALLDRLRHKSAGAAAAAAAATSKSRSKLLTHHLITQLAEDEEEKELAGASKCELMLQEYVVSLEEDLRQSQAHCTLLLQDQEELSLERYELLCSLADAYLRLSELEKELNQRVELMKELETDLDKSTLASKQKSKELALVVKERDELRKEGDSMAQEALHMSLELELLNRRLRQLDEELLLKDGQISILRSNWGGDDDDHYV
ncbi:unnamed protein product [Sphagnum balticum]